MFLKPHLKPCLCQTIFTDIFLHFSLFTLLFYLMSPSVNRIYIVRNQKRVVNSFIEMIPDCGQAAVKVFTA